MDKKKEEGLDVLTGLFKLVEQNPRLSTNEMLALLSLFTLLNIVNLIKPASAPLPAFSQVQSSGLENNLMETLTGLLHNKGPGGFNELAGMLTKNPNAIMTVMNMLSSLKESKNPPKLEEGGKKVTYDEAQTRSIKDKS